MTDEELSHGRDGNGPSIIANSQSEAIRSLLACSVCYTDTKNKAGPEEVVASPLRDLKRRVIAMLQIDFL